MNDSEQHDRRWYNWQQPFLVVPFPEIPYPEDDHPNDERDDDSQGIYYIDM